MNEPVGILLNPEIDKIEALVLERPDTLRICEGFSDENFGVASGYGHTHTHVAQACQAKWGRHWNCFCLIMHRDAKDWVINCDGAWDVHDPENVPLRVARTWVEAPLKQFMDDFIALWRHHYS